jgi:hypothetical protein
MAGRFSSLRYVMSIALLGALPRSPPGGGDERRECGAALGFSAILVGWLVPTVLVVRGHAARRARASPGAASKPTSLLGRGADVVLGAALIEGVPWDLRLTAWGIAAAASYAAAFALAGSS